MSLQPRDKNWKNWEPWKRYFRKELFTKGIFDETVQTKPEILCCFLAGIHH